MIAIATMPEKSETPVSSDRPMAPPRNSARSVAMAATSLATHMSMGTGCGKRSRDSSARFWPVTMPSLADSAWNSIATTFAASTAHNRL